MSDKPFFPARVVSFESRQGGDMARLIEKLGGTALGAPTLREVPLTDQSEAFAFAEVLLQGQCDVLVLLTGAGTQTLLDAMSLKAPLPELLKCLAQVDLVCRGPKPLRVIKALGLTPRCVASEPNTSAQMLLEMQAALVLAGRRVFIQEYGTPNLELTRALTSAGASVRQVPVYAWQLPEDLAPLRRAIDAIAQGNVDVALFTSARQVDHLLQVAEQMGQTSALRSGLQHTVVASIGPVTTEALQRHGLPVDTEPEHSKMGQLVTHVARTWKPLLAAKTHQVQPN
jgi:uroporphyrinogen-III synthase